MRPATWLSQRLRDSHCGLRAFASTGVARVLACFCKEPDGSDLSRERIIVATFAGFYAQKRYCELRCFDYLSDQIFVDLTKESGQVPEYWHDFILGNVESAMKNGTKRSRLKNLSNWDSPITQDAAEVVAHSRNGAAIYRIGGQVTRPKPLNTPDPTYSDFARGHGYEGTTLLMATLNEYGKVEEISVLRPSGFGLDENAVRAVRGWSFQPAMLNGKRHQSE